LQEQKEHMKTPIIKDDEIDLIEVAKTIWAGKNLFLMMFFFKVKFFLISENMTIILLNN
jgi:LPS O-antigen subunit length determinant protein (WzzB/FepE family)